MEVKLGVGVVRCMSVGGGLSRKVFRTMALGDIGGIPVDVKSRFQWRMSCGRTYRKGQNQLGSDLCKVKDGDAVDVTEKAICVIKTRRSGDELVRAFAACFEHKRAKRVTKDGCS